MNRIPGKSKKISHKAGQFIPMAVRDSAVDLERLLTAYYEWSESAGQFGIESKKLLDNFSHRTADSKFLQHFKDSLLRMFPDISDELLRHLLKFSRVFYRQRGTPESYQFLFKALWGDDTLELTYPSNYILKSSDGVWGTSELIQLDMSNVNEEFNIEGTLLVGRNSGTRAYVSRIKDFTEDDMRLVLELNFVSGDFNVDEDVDIYADTDATKLINTVPIIPVLGDYEIVNPGKGYMSGRTISIETPGDGTDLKVKLSGVDSFTGGITTLDIIEPGVGYKNKVPTLNLDDVYLYDVTLPNREIAEINITFTANYEGPGNYIEKKSLLSDLWKLRDGDYYQEYSYVINTKVDRNKVMGPVKELLHPAGMAVFYKRSFDAADLNYEDLSDSYFTATSHFATKSDRLMRYSNYVNYSASDAFYI